MPPLPTRSARRRAGPRATLLAAALLVPLLAPLASCRLLDEPGRPPTFEGGPRLEVLVRLADAGEPAGTQLSVPGVAPTGFDPTVLREPSLVVEAALQLGAPRGGGTRALVDDTLRVAGMTLRAVKRDPSMALYRLVLPVPPSRFGERGFAIERVPRPADAPALDALPPALGAVSRLDPDTIVVVAGEDLRLHLSAPSARPTEPAMAPYERWQVTLSPLPPVAVSAVPTTLGGTGAPPREIVVPANLLPAMGGAFAVRLTYDAMAGSSFFSSDQWAYRAGLRTSTALRWTVRRVERAP